jgi:hypothetical protein
LNFEGSFDNIGYLNNLLNNLRNFNNSLFSLNNHNWLLDDSINWYISNFNMVFNLFSCDNFSFFFDSSNVFLNFNDLWDSNNLLDDFFNNNWHLDNLFDDLLNCNDLFSNNFNFSNLS